MNDQQVEQLETQIRAAVGNASPPNFDQWQKINQDTLDQLAAVNPQSKSKPSRRYRALRISLTAAAAIFCLIAISSILAPRNPAFSKTIEAINLADTISWVRSSYQRITSKDKQRFWLKKQETKAIYMSPGFYRYDYYDSDGELTLTSIVDPVKKQRLSLNHLRKTFEIKDREGHEVSDKKADKSDKLKLAKLNVGPFARFNRAVREGGEFVGQRVVDGQKVNVFRWRNKAMGIYNPKNVSDVWIDAKTENVVGTSEPGSSVFDPDKLEYRDNPSEAEFSVGKILGSITKNIVLDPKVDPAIFKFDIPQGYSKAPAAKAQVFVTEPELIEWLEILAKINDRQFVDGFIVRNTKKIAESQRSENPSELEKARRKIWSQHEINGNSMPLWDFVEANTFAEDCKYLGKGVKLGEADKPVLIYRLKLTGKYRVVYGDLRIEDLSDEEAKQLKSN